MKLESISFRNIGPYGNKIVDLNLLEEGGLWLVFGRNGQGKSILLNMTKALYYGKIDKVKKDEIANRFNKHGWIYGKVKSQQGEIYEIERGFSPSSLSVKKDGVDLDIAGISNAQSFIDNEVTMMPYQIYSNIVSLSVNDFKSFLTMKPSDKREIIDRIFSIDILNTMSVYVKSEMKNIKFEVDLLDREIVTINHSIESYKAKIEELKNQAAKDNTEKINSINESISELKPKYENSVSEYNSLIEKQNTIVAYIRKIEEAKNLLRFEIQTCESKLHIYDNDRCPTCNSQLDSAEHISVKTKLIEDKEALVTKLDSVIITEQRYSEGMNELNNMISKVTYEVNNYKRNWDELVYHLNMLSTTQDQTNYSNFNELISSELGRINLATAKKEETNVELGYLSILDKLYGSDGVKQQIIESYLPILNEEIELTLRNLHFPYDVTFDKDFEPNISHIGYEVSPDTLSTGEKKKVDIAVLISIIRIMKRKYPQLNIFMLDEVLSSIDQDGVTDIIKFLQETAKELKINIFIVNHAPLPLEYFDRQISVNKKDNFSEIDVVNLV